MLCAKFSWNWQSGSGEEDFKFCHSIFTISLLSPLGIRCEPSFEDSCIPFIQRCFVPMVVEKKLYKFCHFATCNSLLSPHGKGCKKFADKQMIRKAHLSSSELKTFSVKFGAVINKYLYVSQIPVVVLRDGEMILFWGVGKWHIQWNKPWKQQFRHSSYWACCSYCVLRKIRTFFSF